MPHLRELVKLHQDAPFSLIGINTADDPDKYRKGLEDYQVTWPSIYQGKDSVLSKLFDVSGYPTYFLIDPAGKLVHQGHSSRELDRLIQKLLDDLEQKQGM